MKYLYFILWSSFDDFKRNKLRTFLTILGIFIGISSVVLMMAAGLGLKRFIEQQFQSLGSNLVMITPGKIFSGGGFRLGTSMMTGMKFDHKDVSVLKRIKNVSMAVPFYANYLEIQGSNDSAIYELIASTEEVFTLLNLEIDFGQLYDKADVDKNSKVVVLGSSPAEKIFGSGQKAIGKNAKIESQNFRVIGILKSIGGGGFGGLSMDDHVFIPYTAAYSFNPSKKFFALYAKLSDENIIEQTKEDISEAFLKRYSEDDFTVSDHREVLNAFGSIFNILNLVLVAVAAISLIVSGIGIMNIMYVSVVNRVKEIGIKRAFGARASDILYLFLSESILLSLMGGALGLIVSYIVVYLLQKIFPAYIDLYTIALALVVSGSIGIIFGILPAKKAADMPPIEAIRQPSA